MARERPTTFMQISHKFQTEITTATVKNHASRFQGKTTQNFKMFLVPMQLAHLNRT